MIWSPLRMTSSRADGAKSSVAVSSRAGASPSASSACTAGETLDTTVPAASRSSKRYGLDAAAGTRASCPGEMLKTSATPAALSVAMTRSGRCVAATRARAATADRRTLRGSASAGALRASSVFQFERPIQCRPSRSSLPQ